MWQFTLTGSYIAYVSKFSYRDGGCEYPAVHNDTCDSKLSCKHAGMWQFGCLHEKYISKLSVCCLDDKNGCPSEKISFIKEWRMGKWGGGGTQNLNVYYYMYYV